MKDIFYPILYHQCEIGPFFNISMVCNMNNILPNVDLQLEKRKNGSSRKNSSGQRSGKEKFFKGIHKATPCKVYIYENQLSAAKANYKLSDCPVKSLMRVSFKGVLLYSIRPFLAGKYDTLVLMLHFAHISTWLLLLLKPFHKKKIIIWGHGISVKRYLQEEKA